MGESRIEFSAHSSKSTPSSDPVISNRCMREQWNALVEDGLRVDREIPVSVYFRGQTVGAFRADMIVESVVLLELKAGARLDPMAEAQLLTYLRATRLEVGLILHFGVTASFRRRIVTNDRKLIP